MKENEKREEPKGLKTGPVKRSRSPKRKVGETGKVRFSWALGVGVAQALLSRGQRARGGAGKPDRKERAEDGRSQRPTPNPRQNRPERPATRIKGSL